MDQSEKLTERIEGDVEEIGLPTETVSRRIRSGIYRTLNRLRQPTIDIQKFLADRGIQYSIEDGRYIFTLPDFQPTLPHPAYAFKGGVARMALQKVLHLPTSKPRDLDVVRCTQYEPEPGMDARISAQFMPEDFAHGYGVEEFQQDYFDTRDFTINEVLIQGNKITATKACIEDTISRTIRITQYERDKCEDISEKQRAKALRFLASNVDFILSDTWYKEDCVSYGTFWFALYLDRAAQQGMRVQEEYIHLLHETGVLPQALTTYSQIYHYLMSGLEYFTFQFFKEVSTEWDHRLDALYEIQDELHRLSQPNKKAKLRNLKMIRV